MKRLLLLVVVIVGLLASSSLARQWSSRSGGFSVEAELVDVKDGNVILKKQDGSQISVPLNKLSLGDVQYIGDVFKSAEARVTGGKTDSSAPVAGKAEAGAPDNAAKVARPSAATLKKLHYAWKKGETYVYHVRIIGERGDDTENRTGDVTYKVKSTRFGEIELGMTGSLKYADVENPRTYVILPGRHVRFISRVEEPKEVAIRIDPHGRLLESRGEAPLPYLLGDLSELIVEPLPQTEEASWTIARDPGIAVVSVHYPYWRSSLAASREGVPATEKTVYTVEGESDKLITVAKHYAMTSAATLAGKPRIEATGEGKLKFDPQRGVFASLDFDMRVSVRDSNKTEETPLHLSYRLLSEEDIAEAAKEAKKVKDEAEKAKKEKERPLTAKEIEAAVADLASDDQQRINNTIRLFNEKKPSQPNAKAAQALETVMLKSENGGYRAEAAKALKNWSTPESVSGLLKALKDQWSPVRSNAIEALIKYAPKEAIKPVAQQLTDGMTRGSAAKFLKAMGPDAEDAVLRNSMSAMLGSARRCVGFLK